MSKQSKGVMKAIGDKLIGGLGGKGSSSKKDKDVKPLLPKKKVKEAHPEVEGMDVDAPIPPSAVHRPGKGKSRASLERVKNLMDGVEEEIEEVADVLKIESCRESELPNLI